MARLETGADLEHTHVHQVYDQIAPCFAEISQKAWPNVRKFLKEQTPGSLIADVGCGTGRYLHINNKVFKLGLDICCPLVEFARTKSYDVIVADNLKLPYRDDIFDAVISIGVVHHFATHERRIQAVQELCRVLRPGGQLMIYVWAYEQKHRRFDGQDVLIPWYGKRNISGSFSRLSYSDRDQSSTSSFSEDDISVNVTGSTQSLQNLGGSFSDPFDSGNVPKNSVVAYVDNSDKMNKQLTKRQRSNTLPSTLYGYAHPDIFDKHSKDSDELVQECKKLEASLKALSANQHRFSSLDMFEYDNEFEMEEKWSYDMNLNNQSKVRFDVGSLECLDKTEYDTVPGNKSYVNNDKMSKNLRNDQQLKTSDKNKEIEQFVDDPFIFKKPLDTCTCQNLEQSQNFVESSPYSPKTLVREPQRKSSVQEMTQTFQFWKSKKKAKTKKVSVFDNIKTAISSFFDGKSDGKSRTEKKFIPLESNLASIDFEIASNNLQGLEGFAVREFPLSSCPVNLLPQSKGDNQTCVQRKMESIKKTNVHCKGDNSNYDTNQGTDQQKFNSEQITHANVLTSNGFLKSGKSKSFKTCSKASHSLQNETAECIAQLTDSSALLKKRM